MGVPLLEERSGRRLAGRGIGHLACIWGLRYWLAISLVAYAAKMFHEPCSELKELDVRAWCMEEQGMTSEYADFVSVEGRTMLCKGATNASSHISSPSTPSLMVYTQATHRPKIYSHCRSATLLFIRRWLHYILHVPEVTSALSSDHITI